MGSEGGGPGAGAPGPLHVAAPLAAARLPHGAACPLVSAQQLAWGVRYRPSPSEGHLTLRLPTVNRRLARRTWMCLPGLPGPGTAIAEVPSTATPMAQQIWRGIHEGAHLDHLSSLARLNHPLAPNPGEFGAGLLVAESYAMAVEILAAVECVLAGQGHAVRQLGAGLIERATRLPGGSNPAAEFADLPTLAEVYVLGPLEVLAGGLAAALPAEITRSLRERWRSACAAYPPAAAFGSAAAELVGWPLFGPLLSADGGAACRRAPPWPLTGCSLPDHEIFIDVNPAEIDIVYLATLSSFMVLTDPGRETPWVSGKGWMRGGPQRSEWPTSREERASNAPAGGRVVRDE